MAYKINPFTGLLDKIEDENFSYNYIEGIIKVPKYQQMGVREEIDIEGELQLEGDLILNI